MTPREWVTYEVQLWHPATDQDDGYWSHWMQTTEDAAQKDLAKERAEWGASKFRAVAITHTERVIG